MTAPDAVTARLQTLVDVWRPTSGISDVQLSAQVRQDAIDILVDLSGHMGAHRLLAFARKPAPVQVSYVGYQATAGMSAIDYRLTDGFADPAEMTDGWHVERLWRLRQPFFCYQPPSECPPLVEPPSVARDHVTFGSFNLFAKVNHGVLQVWSEILTALPTAELQLLVPDDLALRQRLLAGFQRHGVRADRIRFVPRGARGPSTLQRFQTVDIALDPFPF